MLIDEILFRAGPRNNNQNRQQQPTAVEREEIEKKKKKENTVSERFCVQVDLVVTRNLNESVSVTVEISLVIRWISSIFVLKLARLEFWSKCINVNRDPISGVSKRDRRFIFVKKI